MLRSPKIYAAFAVIALISLLSIFKTDPNRSAKTLVAIANYGPHSSLLQTIDGIKEELTKLGYTEGENINYEISDVNFETSLIIQMLHKLKASKPDVIVAISTPIAQAAKNLIKDIPVIYANVTNPEEAGLVSDDIDTNITGASDRQDFSVMLDFAKKLLPRAKTVGVLYSLGEANDASMVDALKKTAEILSINVLAVPIEHTRDVATRMRVFKGNVDFIYTGSSGAIQASLPAIASTAESMKLPVFNFNSAEVMSHNVLASYGISHRQIGANAGQIIHRVLLGIKPVDIKPVYPDKADYAGFISRKRAAKIELAIPADLKNVTIVD
ncbi:MAG: hypothetical protein COA94_09035 [Rickettsiales bacterium]|nr:MAG: hypothetical protein COA94_09035 [Rickettsiales bacterium]